MPFKLILWTRYCFSVWAFWSSLETEVFGKALSHGNVHPRQTGPTVSFQPQRFIRSLHDSRTREGPLSLHGSSRNICRLASEELRTILGILEKGVRSLKLLDANSLLKHGRKNVLFVLHRLLDHGSVREVVLRRSPHPCFLSWITSRCRGELSASPAGTSSAEGPADAHLFDFECSADEGEPTAKRARRGLNLELEILCSTFLSSGGVAGHCPQGWINSLDIEVSSCQIFTTLSRVLPSWSRLHTLHLQSDCKYITSVPVSV